jgi:hypothetical protein
MASDETTSRSGRRFFFEARFSDHKIIPVLGVRSVIGMERDDFKKEIYQQFLRQLQLHPARPLA